MRCRWNLSRVMILRTYSFPLIFFAARLSSFSFFFDIVNRQCRYAIQALDIRWRDKTFFWRCTKRPTFDVWRIFQSRIQKIGSRSSISSLKNSTCYSWCVTSFSRLKILLFCCTLCFFSIKSFCEGVLAATHILIRIRSIRWEVHCFGNITQNGTFFFFPSYIQDRLYATTETPSGSVLDE